ncbi:MAG: glycine oxidase [Solirubrobacteraceae bacterium]|jgi:glycine oxidase|nr:glycine oxidase [Solirubrobacteraceae bacterium]
MTSDRGFDVAVVGGGVIGLSVAWRARARGLSVVVLDRGDLGEGTTRVAAGMLAPVSEAEAQERALLALGIESARMWSAFAAELNDVSGLDVGLRTTGTLAVARDRDDKEALERELDLRDRLGVRAQRLLPSAARALEPALAPSIRLAAEFPDDHSVDPRAVSAALVVAAERAGVVLRTGVDVTSLAALEADQIVLAAGPWSAALAPLPVRPVKGQTIRLKGEQLLERTVRFEGGYLVPRADGRIVLGATEEERGFDTAMSALAVHDLLRDAAELVPGILELEIEELVAGLRPGTPDNAPLIGRLDERVVVATGHHRNGILLAPVTARLVVAELVRNPETHAFSPHRFMRAAV